MLEQEEARDLEGYTQDRELAIKNALSSEFWRPPWVGWKVRLYPTEGGDWA